MKRVAIIAGKTLFWAASVAVIAWGWLIDVTWLQLVGAIPFGYRFIIFPLTEWENRMNAERAEILERLRRIEAKLS